MMKLNEQTSFTKVQFWCLFNIAYGTPQRLKVCAFCEWFFLNCVIEKVESGSDEESRGATSDSSDGKEERNIYFQS